MKEYTLKNTSFKIRYHDFPGSETAILFIHGLGCAGSFDYPNVASQPEVSNHRRILIDLLGAGYSDKPRDFTYTIQEHANYLLDFVNELKLDRFILFGHSLGGSVALTLAAMCEEKVSQLILTEANLDSGGGFTTKVIASFEQSEFISTGFAEMIHENKVNSNELWAVCFSNWLPQAAYQASKSAVEGQTPSWREILYGLSCPKTFIFGEKNMSDPDVNILADHRIRIDKVKDAGHSMAWENPEDLARAIMTSINVVRD